MISFACLSKLLLRYEAFALYDLYFTQINEFLSNTAVNTAAPLNTRPLIWTPILFHCTNREHLSEIFKSGKIKTSKNDCISFTEIQIDQLDRMRLRKQEKDAVAIGFTRSYLETKGLFQPAYLKHSDRTIKSEFSNLRKGYCETDDDLGAFHEMRVPCELQIADAVWILFSSRSKRTKEPGNAELRRICETLTVATSYWDRSHQEGIIKEPLYRRVTYDKFKKIKKLEFQGEFYLRLNSIPPVTKRVTFPAGKSYNFTFPTNEIPFGWAGPYTNYECAEWIWTELLRLYPSEASQMQTRIKYS